jgi:Protein kinase domain
MTVKCANARARPTDTARAAADAEGQPWRLGEYLVTGHLADGGMGRVYAAWHPGLDRVFALKLPKPGFVTTAEGLARFRDEAQTLAQLDHLHITRVYSGGVHDGQPYLAMEFLEGGSLEEEDRQRQFQDPEEALKLLLKLAKAVHYAQERKVLHCDIKPSNILFDEANRPRLSDYGLALKLDRGPVGAESRGGTPGWMAPEQLRPDEVGAVSWVQPLTPAADVFGLGVVLHWLVTGEQPFGNGKQDYAVRVRTEARQPPGRWRPGLDWAVKVIVHKALQVDPLERYTSWGLVADLKRALARRPLIAQPPPSWARAWLWGQRNPEASLAGCLVFFLLSLCGVIGALGSIEYEQELKEAVLDMNAYAASGQAAAVLYKLREHRDALLAASEGGRLSEIALMPALGPFVPWVLQPAQGPQESPCLVQTGQAEADLLEDYARGFDTLQLLDPMGCPRGRFPVPPGDYAQRWFGWRDYFLGATRFGEAGKLAVHVGPVFRSTVSGEVRFSLSAPLFVPTLPPALPGQVFAGVASAGTTVDTTFTLPAVVGTQTHDRVTALLGPFEGESRRFAQGSLEYTFLAHPELKRGAEQLLPASYAAHLRDVFGSRKVNADAFVLATGAPTWRADYEDPFLGGHWLAGFAPVGGTGFVVLVQTRVEAAIRPSVALMQTWVYVFAALSLAALVGFVVFVALESHAGQAACDDLERS